MKKVLAILFSVILVLGLFAGCGDKDSGAAGGVGGNAGNNGDASNNGGSTDGGTQATPSVNPSGAVVVNANAAVTVSYDNNGLVIGIEGINENGNIVAGECTDYLGKTCADVVCDIIAGSNLSGFLTAEVNYVMVKQVIGSSVPTDSFMKNLEMDAVEAIEAAESTARLVVLTLEDLDQQGYIGLDGAKKLMQAYMATDRDDYLCVGTDAPMNGLYGFLFGVDDVQEKLVVDATTGDVYMDELEGVDYGDGSFNEEELITEPTEDILGDENEPQETEPVPTPDADTTEPTETMAPEVVE